MISHAQVLRCHCCYLCSTSISKFTNITAQRSDALTPIFLYDMYIKQVLHAALIITSSWLSFSSRSVRVSSFPACLFTCVWVEGGRVRRFVPERVSTSALSLPAAGLHVIKKRAAFCFLWALCQFNSGIFNGKRRRTRLQAAFSVKLLFIYYLIFMTGSVLMA